MQSVHRTRALTLELLLLATLVLNAWFVVDSLIIALHPTLIANAIVIDLTLTAVVCHWFLGCRRGGLPSWTVIPVLAMGVAVSRWLLPAGIAHTGMIALVAWAVVEGSVLTLAVVRFGRLVRAYRQARLHGADSFDALETALLTLAPACPFIAAWARLEIQLCVLCWFGWAFEKSPADGPNTFTHHKTVNWSVIAGVVAALAIIEGGLAHLVLHVYGYTFATWVSAALHVYTFVWVVGDAWGLRLYRTALRTKHGEATLELRVGLRGRLDVPLSNIEQVATGSWEHAGADAALLVVLGRANVRLSFAEETLFKPMFGTPKPVRSLLVHFDDPEAFRQGLEQSLPRTSPQRR